MMNENNLKIKVSAKEQNLAQNANSAFDQHKFISDIYECEKQKYILETRLSKLQTNINNKQQVNCFENTPYYNNLTKQLQKNIYLPNEPQKIAPGDYLGPIILSMVLGFVLMNISFFVFDIDSFGGGCVSLILSIAVLLFVFISIKKSRYNKEYSEYCAECSRISAKNKNINENNKKLREYWYEEYKKYCQNVEIKAEDYKSKTKSEYDEAVRMLKNVRYTLISLYNFKINGVLCLHPNYRGLVTISIIHGYFDTGRCTQLQGHEGAYNLYEDEKMKGMIINRLDIVSQQLGQLNNSMLYVGQAIQECNSRLSELESASNRMISSVNNMNNNVTNHLNGVSNQMSAIEENTANSAYYAEIGAQMTTFNTVYNLLKD